MTLEEICYADAGLFYAVCEIHWRDLVKLHNLQNSGWASSIWEHSKLHISMLHKLFMVY